MWPSSCDGDDDDRDDERPRNIQASVGRSAPAVKYNADSGMLLVTIFVMDAISPDEKEEGDDDEIGND